MRHESFAALPGSAPQMQMVSASSLVRNFGKWRDRALAAPLCIHHRGEPKLVLTAFETMVSLCADRSAAAPTDDPALLDTMRELVIVLDGDLAVVRMNRAARLYLAVDAQPGMLRLDMLFAPSVAGFLTGAARRVVESRVAERLELTLIGPPERQVSLGLVPMGGGVALVGQDVSERTAMLQAQAATESLDAAMGVLEGVAAARINERGYLEAPAASVARLARLPADGVASIRFVSLFALVSRPQVAEALEAVLTSGRPMSLEAQLLLGGTEAAAVNLGLAPLRPAARITGVQAMIVRHGQA